MSEKYINVQDPKDSVEAKRKKKAAEAVYPINLEKIQARFLVVLSRESRQLMHESFEGKLAKTSAEDLVRYSKLIKELLSTEEKKAENMSTEQLQSLVGDSEKS